MRPAAALTFLLALGCNDDEVVRPPHIQSTALQCGSDADEPCWCGDTKGVLPCSQGGGEMVCDCSAIAELRDVTQKKSLAKIEGRPTDEFDARLAELESELDALLTLHEEVKE